VWGCQRARVCAYAGFGDTFAVRLLNFGIRVLVDGKSIQIGAGCDVVIEKVEYMKMEGRRLSAPCSNRRILANKKRARAEGFVNSVKKLQRREISSKRHRAFTITNAQERFRNMRLMVSFSLSFFQMFSLVISLFIFGKLRYTRYQCLSFSFV
jgi:hypothetical protein